MLRPGLCLVRVTPRAFEQAGLPAPEDRRRRNIYQLTQAGGSSGHLRSTDMLPVSPLGYSAATVLFASTATSISRLTAV